MLKEETKNRFINPNISQRDIPELQDLFDKLELAANSDMNCWVTAINKCLRVAIAGRGEAITSDIINVNAELTSLMLALKEHRILIMQCKNEVDSL